MPSKKNNYKKNTPVTAKFGNDGTTKNYTESNVKAQTDYSSGKEKSLEDLFEDGLKDIYSAEKQLIEVLPKLAKAADSEELRDMFEQHFEETKRQVERLEKIFSRLSITNTGSIECVAMKGLIIEIQKIIDEYEESPVRDSALIIGSQKAEHYEIASYGSLCELADVLGYGKVRDILGRSLDEEENSDENLTYLARDVNDEAFDLSRTSGTHEWAQHNNNSY